MMVQYYKRPKNIRDVLKGLRTIPEDVEAGAYTRPLFSST
jgi:hypothetical protein